MADRKAAIARLISEGLTDTEIAAALGITHNAVIGARHRMGISGNNTLRPNGEPRATPVRSMKAYAAAIAALEEVPPAPIAPAPIEDADESVLSAKKSTFWHPVAELTEYTCRWPVGDPSDPGFRYCLAPKPVDQPYCTACSQLAYAPRHGRAA